MFAAKNPITRAGHFQRGSVRAWRNEKRVNHVGTAVWSEGNTSFIALPASTVLETQPQKKPPSSGPWKLLTR